MKSKKRRVINANYPPKDVSQEELRRIWGDPDEVEPIPHEWRKNDQKRKPSPV
jgi:hypothetical protein